MSGETETDSEVNTMIGWLLRRKGWALLPDGRFRFLTERGAIALTPEQLDQLKPTMGEVFSQLVQGFEVTAREEFRSCLAFETACPVYAGAEVPTWFLEAIIARAAAAAMRSRDI